MIDLKKVVITEKKVDTILTKSNLPIAGYSINPYVGCPFGCEYCYEKVYRTYRRLGNVFRCKNVG